MNKLLPIIIVFFFASVHSSGQSAESDDFHQAEAFADYLFNTRQFDYAAQEYLRLHYLRPADPSLKKRVLESFRLAQDLESGLGFSSRFFDARDTSLTLYYPEMVKIRMLGSAPILREGQVPDSTDFPGLYNQSLMLNYMLQYNWDRVRSEAWRIRETPLHSFTLDLPDDNYLSPFLAATLSTLIPGAGKFYAKRWKDGLTSLLFVGLTAFQSYRGFHAKGTESVYGWVMGTFSAGFYIGNIYGSQKAAKDYNKHLNEHYRDHLVGFYLDRY